jgi:methyl-accepting chemotaxis protein
MKLMRFEFTKLRNRLLVYFGILTFSIIIVQAVVSYSTVKSTLQKDIREQQLMAFLEASQAELRASLEKGLEASIALANDQLLIDWFASGESDRALSHYALEKVDQLYSKMGYPNAFAVSNSTKKFYVQGHTHANTLSESNSSDRWFYDLLRTGERYKLNYDYNAALDQTFFFYNVVMGDLSNPSGIAGVGIDPGALINQFVSRKITQNAVVWMVDSSGNVIISENEDEIGSFLGDIVDATIVEQLLANKEGIVLPNRNFAGLNSDFAVMPVGNTGLSAVLVAPISELLAVIRPIAISSSILSILFLGITLIIVMWLAGSITKPLSEITNHSDLFANGDLTNEISADALSREDELGQLAQSFTRLKSQLGDMIAQASSAAQTISKGNVEMTNSASRLAESATEQASSTEELSASMEEMGSNITQNADNANQAVLIVQDAAKEAKSGESMLMEAVHAIETINESVVLIEDVARQTNILALNAAIEAARAGEHGRGFAVVAGEVRRLAERSRINAEKINQLSGNSVDIARQAMHIFAEMVPKIMKSAELVMEISAASKEQNVGAEQINNALLELDRVSQSNAQAAEDINSMVHQFNDEVDAMSRVVSYFRL